MATITTAYRGEMSFETTLGNHRLTIDVPEGMGGRDRGPTPPELFIASRSTAPVHETIATMSGIRFDIRDSRDQAILTA